MTCSTMINRNEIRVSREKASPLLTNVWVILWIQKLELVRYHTYESAQARIIPMMDLKERSGAAKKGRKGGWKRRRSFWPGRAGSAAVHPRRPEEEEETATAASSRGHNLSKSLQRWIPDRFSIDVPSSRPVTRALLLLAAAAAAAHPRLWPACSRPLVDSAMIKQIDNVRTLIKTGRLSDVFDYPRI